MHHGVGTTEWIVRVTLNGDVTAVSAQDEGAVWVDRAVLGVGKILLVPTSDELTEVQTISITNSSDSSWGGIII